MIINGPVSQRENSSEQLKCEAWKRLSGAERSEKVSRLGAKIQSRYSTEEDGDMKGCQALILRVFFSSGISKSNLASEQPPHEVF